MRYKVVLYPMFDETLAIVTTMFESYERGTDFTRHYQLKTHGDGWDLEGRLRELADAVSERQEKSQVF